MITNAFTCTGPYSILIMLGIKRVENRSVMPVPLKGRCAVGCSKKFCKEEFGEFVRWASQALSEEDFERIPAWADVKDWPGKIVGCCDYAARPESAPYQDVRRKDPPHAARPESAPYQGEPREPWDEGYGSWWDLSNVVCFDNPIPCRGNVGMWQMPDMLARQVTAADTLAACVGETVTTSADALRIFRVAVPLAGGNEGLFVLPLDAERRVLSEPVLVSLGDPSTTVVAPDAVFAAAFKVEAKAIILAHNHPSGDPTPSVQDRELTAALATLGEQLGIGVLDHLVLGESVADSVCAEE